MRTDDRQVIRTAKKAFARCSPLWFVFGDEIRNALIDSVIMDEIRLADETSELGCSAGEIVAFRARV